MRIGFGFLSIVLLVSACDNTPLTIPPKESKSTPVENHVDVATEIMGKQEQEACVPKMENNLYAQSDCDEGLVCAPNFDDISVGTCRVSCLGKVKGRSVKKFDACPAGRTCQIAISSALDPLGVFCLPKQNNRDGKCLAMNDAEACGNNRQCMPSDVAHDASGQPVVKDFICRDTCPFGTPGADRKCGNGEVCEASPYIKDAGICVVAVSWAREADFSTGGFSGQSCNEISAHRFCDKSLLGGLEKPAHLACIEKGSVPDNGFCVAVCSTPAIGEEKGSQLMCPAGFTCSLGMSRKLGLAKSLKKICDPSKCEVGKPCAEQCGPGDAECITTNTQKGKVSVCAAPFGTCQPG